MEQVESDYRTCKTNEVTYEEAIEACQDETIKFKDRNEILVGQIEKEKDRVVYWR
ncbi:MAG: hypothetical protein GWN40_08770, partial [Nitrosopumilaceae archaeon]|nr:hypothetical protein [Nitrosopumilaceae archaeon]